MASRSCDIDVILDETASAKTQMEKDRVLISQLETLQKPLLRLYEWSEPSVTYGYFIDPVHKHYEISPGQVPVDPQGEAYYFITMILHFRWLPSNRISLQFQYERKLCVGQ